MIPADRSPILNPLRLLAGAASLEPQRQKLHAAYVAAAQQADGGFAGRQGGSDAYYSGFALRSLVLLGALDDTTADRLAAFVQSLAGRRQPLVDFLSGVTSAVMLEAFTGSDPFAAAGVDREAAFRETVAAFRRPDGGYAKSARGASSTYATFLIAWTGALMGLPRTEADGVLRFLAERRRDDGGYAEAAALRQGGTNPTAAAVGLMRLAGVDEPPACSATAAFLRSMQDASGGFLAGAGAPVADLLSTHTALTALVELNAADAADLAAARALVETAESSQGGFRAGAWDDTVDVEYTYYGLATLALLGSAT